MVHGGSPSTGRARAPQVLIRDHERAVDDETRRREGVHYTPPALARMLAELAIDQILLRTGELPRSICDPTCGAGSFLVAVADVLVARGLDAAVVPCRLHGADTDAEALQVARTALDRWSEGHRVDPASGSADGPRLWQADTATTMPSAWPSRPERGYDVVVGNPPFLNQLARRTARGAEDRDAVRRRFGDVGAYADGASVFLLGALDLVRAGGAVVMVQPQSFLATRD
ncbi:MAG: N-6 DNA methylase, partial [Microthrixaceae bacterium]